MGGRRQAPGDWIVVSCLVHRGGSQAASPPPTPVLTKCGRDYRPWSIWQDFRARCAWWGDGIPSHPEQPASLSSPPLSFSKLLALSRKSLSSPITHPFLPPTCSSGPCSPCPAQSGAGTCRASCTAGRVARGHPTAPRSSCQSGGYRIPAAGTSRWLLWVSWSQQTPCRGPLGKRGEGRRFVGNGRPASTPPHPK